LKELSVGDVCLKDLTREEIMVLKKIKAGGVYRDKRTSGYLRHESYRTSERVLFKVMQKYLEFRDWGNSFKSKYFCNIFSDCPLSRGEVRAAITYGNRMGLLRAVNGRYGNRGYKLKKG